MYAIAVSDVHLGYDAKCDINAFDAFIAELETPTGKILPLEEKVSHLILMGDILDLWRRDNDIVLDQHRNLLQRIHDLHSRMNVHWVWGNHDYETCLVSLIEREIGDKIKFTDILRLPGNSRTLQNGESYVFVHGHQIEFGRKGFELAGIFLCNAGEGTGAQMTHTWATLQNVVKTLNPIGNWFREKYFNYIQKDHDERDEEPVTGFIQKRFWNFYSGFQPIPTHNEEKVRGIASRRISLNYNEILVFGHTHDSWAGTRVSNTGCWYQNKPHHYYSINDSGFGTLQTW
ncbi:MAG: metallophosphoesterase [Candidatus Thorarchaeota archaeon]|jgi:UDP-2,3-diacylglucosamine pyrophosphatase LpxH